MSTVHDLHDALDRLPEVEQRRTWGRATFRVAARLFTVLAPDERHASIRTSPEEQAALVARDAEVFRPAPYVGRHGWVQVRLDGVAPGELADLVGDAWRRTAGARAAVDSAGGPRAA